MPAARRRHTAHTMLKHFEKFSAGSAGGGWVRGNCTHPWHPSLAPSLLVRHHHGCMTSGGERRLDEACRTRHRDCDRPRSRTRWGRAGVCKKSIDAVDDCLSYAERFCWSVLHGNIGFLASWEASGIAACAARRLHTTSDVPGEMQFLRLTI